jgi:hypothetical protein
MPVFYLAMLAAALVIGVASWARAPRSRDTVASMGRATIPDRAESSPSSVGAGSPKPDDSPRPDVVKADDPILRTPDGLRRKVVVKDLDIVCQSKASGGRPVGSPLDYFSIHYLFGEIPGKDTPWYQIGPRDGPPRGWIPGTAALEWDTRLMANPTGRAGRPALVIYRDEKCLLDALAHRVCPRHNGRCPTEGEEQVKDSGDRTGTPVLGMPILRSRSIPQPGGSPRTIFEVASLVRDQAPPPPPPAQPPAEMLPLLRRLDIAFVIDTTASMQATIEAARTLSAKLVADASRRYRDLNLRLALVEYRDDSPAFGFKTQVVTQFTDPAAFRAALGRIRAADRGDGSVDEAVLDGVDRALQLDWPTGRAGELATKLIVLLGDSPDHAADLERATALAGTAQQSKITIATVALDRPGQLTRDEKARYHDQWRTLAERSFRPLDKATGYTQRVPPALLSPDRADEIVTLVESLIHDRMERARELAALAAADAEGRLRDYVNSQGLTLDQVAPVLADLHRNEADATNRPDPRLNGRKAPSVRRGWIAERIGSKPLVAVEILISHSELELLIDELTRLQQAAQGSAKDLSDLLRIGTAAASGETSFLAADRGTQTFAEHLGRRQGLPPAHPDSLLLRTQADLLQADDLYRAALNRKLSASLAELVRYRDSADWSNPKRSIDGMMMVPYALIDF